jgi:hypothetical protein
MSLRKAHLRECGRVALEQRGFRVEPIKGPGILPGARLWTVLGDEKRRVAVRTSLDREVGLTRHPDGGWRTIPNVDEVIVVVPSAEHPGAAEVLSFDPDVLVSVFDATLAAREKQNADFSPKAPIFVALDRSEREDPADIASGLKARAQWQTLVPLSAVPLPCKASEPASTEGFIDRVKREFAQLNGVDVSKVVVEFRIIA